MDYLPFQIGAISRNRGRNLEGKIFPLSMVGKYECYQNLVISKILKKTIKTRPYFNEMYIEVELEHTQTKNQIKYQISTLSPTLNCLLF